MLKRCDDTSHVYEFLYTKSNGDHYRCQRCKKRLRVSKGGQVPQPVNWVYASAIQEAWRKPTLAQRLAARRRLANRNIPFPAIIQRLRDMGWTIDLAAGLFDPPLPEEGTEQKAERRRARVSEPTPKQITERAKRVRDTWRQG